jgi:AcrR family transcriptional regulator
VPKIVDAAARRQEIVDAVCRIIASDGLERASLREVADEAGLAVGSVRHYFASSEELLAFSFASVVDRIVARLSGAYAGVSASSAGSETQRSAVLTLLGEFLPLDEQRALDACAWLAFKNAARIRPFLAAEADRSHRAVAAVVGQLITSLVDDDGGGQQRLVTEAERLLATLDGLTMHALLQPEWMTLEMCRDVLESHLAGLEGPLAPKH